MKAEGKVRRKGGKEERRRGGEKERKEKAREESINDKREDIYFNARKEPRLRNPVTGHPLELDVWIPALKLCFEFQVFFIYFLNRIIVL